MVIALRPAGRFLVVASSFGTLRSLPPHPRPRFDTGTMSRNDVDEVMRDYAAAVQGGRDQDIGWPGWINIASKVEQVAAMRVYARTAAAGPDGQRAFIAAVCPGLVDTDASRPWFADMTAAQSPMQAAEDVVQLALGPARQEFHGELIQHHRILPWS